MKAVSAQGTRQASPRYFEHVAERELGPRATRPPVCLYLQTTIRSWA